MPRPRPPYPPEFRQQIVDLHRAGRTFAELADEFEPSKQTLRAWVAHAQPSAGTAAAGTDRALLPGGRPASTTTPASPRAGARLKMGRRCLSG